MLSFHGYWLNQEVLEARGMRMVPSTLYRCLDRLAERGMLTVRWELPEGRRQWRQVYSITPAGRGVAAGHRSSTAPSL